MTFLIISLLLFIICGFAALVSGRSGRWATAYGVLGAVAGAASGLVCAIAVLCGGGAQAFKAAWAVPFGSFNIGVDALSAFFLLPIFVLSGLCAVYGAGYMSGYAKRKSLGPPWFFFNVLVASMVMVVVARNAVLFLMAWEVMSLASFFLVTFDDEKEAVRKAGWIYLVATHLGTAFLFAMFILLGSGDGLDFDAFKAPAAIANVVFVLALVGFGTKAGIMPFHVWLPEAHPAAPSHVSALMSGVMIKVGIYGLVRTLTFLGTPPSLIWWAWALIVIGAVSGVLGVVFALAQHDLKRLLAYHSVENIGIIVMGIGVGMLGVYIGSAPVAALGFAGGLLHVLNHAMFKGLLFLGAGSVLHETGTRDIDALGGLLKKMPVTGLTFLVGAVAISGLPPLNGFVSEFLVYLGVFSGAASSAAGSIAMSGMLVIAALALIGGLAAACFTKAFGIIFLGEARSKHAEHAHDPGVAMRAPMIILAAVCFLIAFLSPLLIPAFAPVCAMLGPNLDGAGIAASYAGAASTLTTIVIVSAACVAAAVALAWLRRRLLAKREVREAGTWDCGYVAPTAKMQYTSSSYAQPLTFLFRFFLRTKSKYKKPEGYFPDGASFETETPDMFTESVYAPAFKLVGRTMQKFRFIQAGNVHLYVLYIAVTLVALLIWKLT